jgi:hypothetical protein
MKSFRYITILFLYVSQFFAQSTIDSSSVQWTLDKVKSIGGYCTLPLNEFPSVSETINGKHLSFDGTKQAVLVEGNPVGNAESFTIEVILKPDSSRNSLNREQRFVHIRSKFNDDRRILIELRLKTNQQWSLDTFIKSEKSKCTLLDSTKYNHPVGKWYHVALVYQNGIMKHFVNGVEELSGMVEYLPIQDGRISIGARQDPRNWYKGSIKSIRITKRALAPNKFLYQTN